ncbi:MAG TPA: BON domain-containing protein [Gracilimonas sp.]|uniref:BON domain-containing protein n=1 Tax=Gracilimonas sp. TaxID=1974203 RepID=UPI002D8C5CBE|nr:BON domain-containing protein [Gracilimonas sp.]
MVLIIFSTQVACNAQEEEQVEVDQPADAEITTAISSDLITTRGIDPDIISVSTQNGIVTLTGTTDNILTKQRAARVASTTRGVRSIVNQIVVEGDKTDEALADDIESALLSDPATDRWEIESSVEDGIVKLTGVVDSWQEKELVATITKGVDGVEGIINDISVDYTVDRTDMEIESEIESSLAWNSRIDAGLLEVDSENGVVTLSGSVGSLYEKQLATSIAHVAGITEVVTNDLEVKSWLREDMKRTDFLADKSDADIREAILDAFDQHPRVNEDLLYVEVENGSVTLTGTVTNLKAARAAAQVVKNTHGVLLIDNKMAVSNEIVVEPDMNYTDVEVKEDILEALIRDPYVTASDIDVRVEDGKVTLSGTTDSYFEKYEADEVTSRVNGVIEITNNITVDYEELVYEPMFMDWDVIAFDYDFVAPQNLTDNELKAAVNEELLWSPFVSTTNVDVVVENGEVTLKGEVISLNAVFEATEEAYEAGATLVNNNLSVM